MLVMLFLKIYIGFSLFTFVLLLMQSYLIEKELIRKYPDAMNKYRKDNKRNILEKICSYIKTFVSCFVPIIHMGIFYVSLFGSDKLSDKLNEKILKELEPYRHE